MDRVNSGEVVSEGRERERESSDSVGSIERWQQWQLEPVTDPRAGQYSCQPPSESAEGRE